jgi:hypothetical protein
VLSKKKFLNIKNKTVRKKDNVEKIFNELELKEFNAFTKEFYKNIYLKINKQYYRE